MGIVHCGHCYKRGHNRRSCPEIKTMIAEDPTGYHARMEMRRKEYKAQNPRRCGFCHQTGHNKTTCCARNEMRSEVLIKIVNWRESFIQLAEKIGFGYGTLVKFNPELPNLSDWRRERIRNSIKRQGPYAIVMGFRTERLDHRQKSRASEVVWLKTARGDSQTTSCLPREFLNLLEGNFETDIEIVGPTKANKLNKSLGDKWSSGLDSVNYHIPDSM